MSDWIKVHRKLLDSDVFANQTTLKIWMWLLLKAHYKDKVVSLKTGKGYEDVVIKRGKVLFGRNTAEEKLKISASCIYRHIKKLEKLKKITVKSNNHYSIITICKYDLYQSVKDESEQQIGQPITQPIGQPKVIPTDTNKNIQEREEVNKLFNTMPLPENFNGLPELKNGSVIQLVKITKQVDLTAEQVNGLWGVFKNQCLTGKKYYQNEDDVYSHFINWSKTQKFNNGEQSITGGDKSAGSTSRKKIDALRDY